MQFTDRLQLLRESSSYFGYDIGHLNIRTPRSSECDSGGPVYTIGDDHISNPYYEKESKFGENVALEKITTNPYYGHKERHIIGGNVALEKITANPYYGQKERGQKKVPRNIMFVQKSMLNPYYCDKD